MHNDDNSQQGKKPAKRKVGRPRTRPVGEATVLSLKVEDDLILALEEELEATNRGLPKGRAAISRGELVRLALWQWLASRAKSRYERAKASK